MSSNSVCNHTCYHLYDYTGLQTELNSTQSYYHYKSLLRFVDNWKHLPRLSRAALCQWATCTRQLSFQKLLQTRSRCRSKVSNKKTLFGKRVQTLSIRVQTTKPHFDLFLPGMNVKENVNVFFCRARVQKGVAWHIDGSSVVWTLINNGKLW